VDEPQVKKSFCSYCGDAPINHAFSFLESVVSVTLDNQGRKIIKYVPSFVKDFADSVPELLFRILALLKLAKFSPDTSKANSFRSKIIWEEAKKRGIAMEQVIFLGKPLDFYRARLKVKDKYIYFESIPIPPEFLDINHNWDDKVFLKKEFGKYGIPVPNYFELFHFGFPALGWSAFGGKNLENIFSKLPKPIIVKPHIGSRGRHTVVNINTEEQFQEGIKIAGEICSYLIVEEHLRGSVCRATLVNGTLAGFYKGDAPALVGDGKKKIRELIADLDKYRGKYRADYWRSTGRLARIGLPRTLVVLIRSFRRFLKKQFSSTTAHGCYSILR